MIRYAKILVLLGLIVSGCNSPKTSDRMNLDKHIETIRNNELGYEDLKKQITLLEKELQFYDKFWLDIANDESYKPKTRRLAAYQFLIKSVKPGITLNELNLALMGQPWLPKQNFHKVENLIGEMPVTFSKDNDAFVIDIFPEIQGSKFSKWAMYLKIEGTMNLEQFYDTVMAFTGETGNEKYRSRKVLEVGFSPDDPLNLELN